MILCCIYQLIFTQHRQLDKPGSSPSAGSRSPRAPPVGQCAIPTADLQAEQAGVEQILRLLQLGQLLAGRRLVELGAAQLGRLRVCGCRGSPLPPPHRAPGAGLRTLLRLLRRLRRALRGEHSTAWLGSVLLSPAIPPARTRRLSPPWPPPTWAPVTTCGAARPAGRRAPLPIGRARRRGASHWPHRPCPPTGGVSAAPLCFRSNGGAAGWQRGPRACRNHRLSPQNCGSRDRRTFAFRRASARPPALRRSRLWYLMLNRGPCWMWPAESLSRPGPQERTPGARKTLLAWRSGHREHHPPGQLLQGLGKTPGASGILRADYWSGRNTSFYIYKLDVYAFTEAALNTGFDQVWVVRAFKRSRHVCL